MEFLDSSFFGFLWHFLTDGGYAQVIDHWLQLVHGSLRSHLTFLVRQPMQALSLMICGVILENTNYRREGWVLTVARKIHFNSRDSRSSLFIAWRALLANTRRGFVESAKISSSHFSGFWVTERSYWTEAVSKSFATMGCSWPQTCIYRPEYPTNTATGLCSRIFIHIYIQWVGNIRTTKMRTSCIPLPVIMILGRYTAPKVKFSDNIESYTKFR